MKKLLLYFTFSAICLCTTAGDGNVVLHSTNNPPSQWNIPADMPDVYYNSELGVITIVDYANVTYYVTIYDDWWNVVITDTKPSGGTIDISSLTSGDYTIEISTSWNHDFEGQFDKCT